VIIYDASCWSLSSITFALTHTHTHTHTRIPKQTNEDGTDRKACPPETQAVTIDGITVGLTLDLLHDIAIVSRPVCVCVCVCVCCVYVSGEWGVSSYLHSLSQL
jgi:hypothetical protein